MSVPSVNTMHQVILHATHIMYLSKSINPGYAPTYAVSLSRRAITSIANHPAPPMLRTCSQPQNPQSQKYTQP